MVINPDRGYFGIGIYQPKNEHNIGTLWRSAFNFGAAFMFTIGKRYKGQCSDTLKAWRHVPQYHYDEFDNFQESRPYSCKLIGIERSSLSIDVRGFDHPERAIYLLGAEDSGLPDEIQEQCQGVVHFESPMCLNVAVAGSIIMFDRLNRKKAGPTGED